MTETNLLGTWELISWQITRSDGQAAYFPFGKQAQGILMYSADGFMSANISHAGRDPFTSPSMRKASAAEKISAFETSFSYAGPYRIEDKTVIHTVEHSLNPTMVGTEQVRHMAFDGDQLTLSADEALGTSGLSRHHQLVWKKA